MFNFLHTFEPNPILISIGPFNIFYYGFFIVCGILLGSLLVFKLADKYQLDKNLVIDSAFVVVLSAIAGGRIYHVFLEIAYYLENPLNIFMLWRGGLAIHGAIIGGLLAIFFFARKHKLNYILLAALYTPALALGQAIGRWGNYFNQELFGKPTDLAWGIPIEVSRRVAGYYKHAYFHPTFLYESLGNLLILLVLLLVHRQFIKKDLKAYSLIIAVYLGLYSILRFSLEFLRIDVTPEFLGLRLPQIASLILIAISLYLIYRNKNEVSKIFKKEEKDEAGSKVLDSLS